MFIAENWCIYDLGKLTSRTFITLKNFDHWCLLRYWLIAISPLKLCMMIISVQLCMFVPVLVTLTSFQGHRRIERNSEDFLSLKRELTEHWLSILFSLLLTPPFEYLFLFEGYMLFIYFLGLMALFGDIFFSFTNCVFGLIFHCIIDWTMQELKCLFIGVTQWQIYIVSLLTVF